MDLFEKIDAAKDEQNRAAKEVDRLASVLSVFAGQVSNWRTHSFSGKLKDGTKARPSNGPDGQIDISVRLPSLEEICVAQQQWLAATENLQNLADEAQPEQWEYIRLKHPELKKSDTSRYLSRD